MEFVNDGETLEVKGERLEYRALLEELLKKDGEAIAATLVSHNVYLPRVINCEALREILNPKIVKARLLDLSDEMLYRLRFYEEFSEYQLQSLFMNIANDSESYKDYLRALFDKIIHNSKNLGITDDILNELRSLDLKEQDFKSFEDALFKCSRDYEDEFDGVNSALLRESLLKSTTTTDLRELGDKYGIVIPKRLKRNEIEAIILVELDKQGKLDDELKERIKKMPVMTLQRLAKNNNIRVSADLKKEDIIEYLFAGISENHAEVAARVELEGLKNDFEFKPEYVDATQDEENRPQNREEKAVSKAIEQIINKSEMQKPVQVDNSETNELLKSLIQEIKETKQAPAEPQKADTETRDLLRELVLEMRKQNSKEEEAPAITVTNEPREVVNEAGEKVTYVERQPQNIRVENNIDTTKLTEALAEAINNAAEKLTANNTDEDKVLAVKLVNDEEEDESLENETIYPHDNFTNQINPIYDENLANSISLADKESINPNYVAPKEEVILSKKEVKAQKLEEKRARKEAKKASNKEEQQKLLEAKKQAKALKKQEKKNRSKNAKQEKLQAHENRKRQKAMEKAIANGQFFDVNSKDFEQFMQFKQIRMEIDKTKRARHDRHMHHVGTFFKLLFGLIILVAIVWLVFVCLFAFDQATGIKETFETWNINGFNFYDNIFAPLVNKFKDMLNK